MNIVKSLQNRIAERLTETKNPCKTYATEEKADQIGEEVAQVLGNTFDTHCRTARYVVVYIPQLNRWTPCFDYSELLSRHSATGGYVGVASDAGFYTF